MRRTVSNRPTTLGCRKLTGLGTATRLRSVEFKWSTYGFSIWRRNLCVFLLTWACYELGASLLLPILQQAASGDILDGSASFSVWHSHAVGAGLALALVGAASVLALVQLKGELVQFQRSTAREYFSSPTNVLDLLFSSVVPCASGLLAVCTAPGFELFSVGEDLGTGEDLSGGEEHRTALFHGTQILVSLGSLLFLLRAKKAVRGLSNTSALLNLLQESFKDMASFLLILCIVCFIQALVLWHLQLVPELTASAVLDAFRFGMGSPNDELYPAEPFSLLWFLYIGWCLVLLIVMLNSLIAILGDTYDRVMEHQRPRGLLERARLLGEIEEQMSRRERESKSNFPGCVHVLIRKEEAEEESDAAQWSGRMAAIKAQVKMLQAEVQASKTATTEAIEESKKAIAEAINENKRATSEALEKAVEKLVRELKS